MPTVNGAHRRNLRVGPAIGIGFDIAMRTLPIHSHHLPAVRQKNEHATGLLLNLPTHP